MEEGVVSDAFDIAAIRLSIKLVRDAGVEGAEYDELIDAMLDHLPALLDAYEQRDRLRSEVENERWKVRILTEDSVRHVHTLLLERDTLRAKIDEANTVTNANRDLLAAAQEEVERMRAVYEAAISWRLTGAKLDIDRHRYRHGAWDVQLRSETGKDLLLAIDAAVAANRAANKEG